MEHIWKIMYENSWKILGNVLEMFGKCLQNIWKIFGKFSEILGKRLENYWKIF